MEQQAPPMFVRALIFAGPGSGPGSWYDIAIADISAMEVPQHGYPAHLIIGGLHARIAWESYAVVHSAWIARRRSSAGR
jgi:hypothetical protein